MRVKLQRVELPALTHVSITLAGSSRSGNNDTGRYLQANRARTTWRLVRLDGAHTGSGLFVDQDAARTYAGDMGWSVKR